MLSLTQSKLCFFENQIEDISKTLHQVRKELGIKEGKELDDPNMLLNKFLDPVFLAFLLKAVNRAFIAGKEKLSYYDIEICLKTLFWLHFYCYSPTAFFDKKVRIAYGPASDLSEELHEGYFL